VHSVFFILYLKIVVYIEYVTICLAILIDSIISFSFVTFGIFMHFVFCFYILYYPALFLLLFVFCILCFCEMEIAEKIANKLHSFIFLRFWNGNIRSRNLEIAAARRIEFRLRFSHRINSQSAAIVLSSLRLDEISANRFPRPSRETTNDNPHHLETSGASDSARLLGRRAFRLTLLLLLARQLAAPPSSAAARMNALGKLTYAGD